MDPKKTGELQRHLEKENELLRDAHRLMLHELHRLQVEEQMLMHKFYEFWSAQGPSRKIVTNKTETADCVAAESHCKEYRRT